MAVVRNQAELDDAIARGEDEIWIDSDPCSGAVVVEADNNMFVAVHNSWVAAMGGSMVKAYDHATVSAFDSARVKAFCDSQVSLNDGSCGELFDSSRATFLSSRCVVRDFRSGNVPPTPARSPASRDSLSVAAEEAERMRKKCAHQECSMTEGDLIEMLHRTNGDKICVPQSLAVAFLNQLEKDGTQADCVMEFDRGSCAITKRKKPTSSCGNSDVISGEQSKA